MKGAVAATAANALSRASGFLREIVFAATFGASMQADAYLAAFRVPNLLRDLFAEGSMSSAFVPTFATTAEREGLESAWALANALLGVVSVVLGIAVLLMMGFANPLVYVVAAGFAETPGKVEATAHLVRIVAPFLGFVSFASILGGMQNVRGRFFVPALAPLAMNLGVIAACLVPKALAEQIGVDPIAVVAFGSVLGGALAAGIQLPGLWREGFRLRPSLLGHPGLRALLVFLGPALLGIATVQLGVLIDVQLASGFGDGPVSQLSYAFRVVQLPMSLFAGSIAVASLAAVANALAKDRRDEARASLGEAVTLGSWIALPCAIALLVAPDLVIALLFEHGRFTAADTVATAALLRAYAIGTLAFSLHRILVPSYFAWGDAWTPMWLSVGTVVAKVPLALILARDELLGVQGIPVAHTVAASLEVVALAALLGRRIGGWTPSVARESVRIGVAGLCMLVAGGGTALLLPGRVGEAAALVTASGTYLLVSLALRLPQPLRVVSQLMPPRGLPPHVEPETAEALKAHAGAALVSIAVEGGAAQVLTDRGALELSVHDDVIRARSTPGAGTGGAALEIDGVLDVSRRPPPLRGLVLTAGDQVVQLMVRDGAIVAAELRGARVRVQ